MADIWKLLATPVKTPTETLVAGTVDFYDPGTTGESNRKDVYTDAAGTIVAANPYTLDSDATATLYGSGTYHVVIKDSSGNTEYDYDFITPDKEVYAFTPATLAELQAITGYPGATATLLARTTLGDGGGGQFYWDSSDLSTDVAADELNAGEGDGGLFIAPASDKTGASGAWVRQHNNIAYPQWWGGQPESTWTGTIDNAPAINKAVNNGIIKKTFLSNGLWPISSFIEFNTPNIELVGESWVDTILVTNVNTIPTINTMIAIKVQPLNGAIRNLRFGNVDAYTGWAIQADSGVSGMLNLFSCQFENVWANFSSTAQNAGFFKGGLYDSWVNNCQFENMGYRFYLTGTAQSGQRTFFTNINDNGPLRPFIYSTLPTRSMTLDDIVVTSAVGHATDGLNAWLDLTDVDKLKVSNIQARPGNATFDPATSYTTFIKLNGGLDANISDVVIDITSDGTSVFNGFDLTDADVILDNVQIRDNNSGRNIKPMVIKGTDNRIIWNGGRIDGASSAQVLLSTGAGGNVTFHGAELINSAGKIFNASGAGTYDLFIKGCKLLNPYLGWSGSTVQANLFNTTGNVEITGGTLGRDITGETANLSNANQFIYSTGTGRIKYEGNNVQRFALQNLFYQFSSSPVIGSLVTGDSALADDDVMYLPSYMSGIVTVSGNSEAAAFLMDQSGALSVLWGTTNTATGSVDGSLCLSSSGGGLNPAIRNRLGAAAAVTVRFDFN